MDQKTPHQEENSVFSCYGCAEGIKMCYRRPCWGTPEDFNKILDAGFAKLVQCDRYYRRLENKPDVKVLTMGLHWDKDSFINAEDMNPGLVLAELLGLAQKKHHKDIRYSKDHTGGRMGNDNPSGKCVMLSNDNECLLHDMNLKPEQGKQACCKQELNKVKDNHYYASLWDTEEGLKVIAKWEELIKPKK